MYMYFNAIDLINLTSQKTCHGCIRATVAIFSCHFVAFFNVKAQLIANYPFVMIKL